MGTFEIGPAISKTAGLRRCGSSGPGTPWSVGSALRRGRGDASYWQGRLISPFPPRFFVRQKNFALDLPPPDIHAARQITYFSARTKDEDKRCDLEAGMAKLLAARVAWAAADNALQIHGGNGFALEYPVSRILCDARILSIFEGAAEIQAQVIARRLVEAQG